MSKIVSRDIEFTDPHNVTIKTVRLENIKNAAGEVLPGSVTRTIHEHQKISDVRKSQQENLRYLNEIDALLARYASDPPKKPQPLPKHLETLLAQIEKCNSWRKERNAYEAKIKEIEGFKSNRNTVIEAMELCNSIFLKRQELYPDSSVEPQDLVDIPEDVTIPEAEAPPITDEE